MRYKPEPLVQMESQARGPTGPGFEQAAEDKSSGLHLLPAAQLETRALGSDIPESGLGRMVLESGPS